MGSRKIRMPVHLTCVSKDAAIDVLAELGRSKAPATRRGPVVTLPGDQPGFLIAIAEWATDEGLAEDAAAARCIAELSDGIDASRGATHA